MPIVVKIILETGKERRGITVRKFLKEGSKNELSKTLQTGKTESQRKRSDEERVREFQRKLYIKAKQEKGFKFYVLYDKVRLDYFLREAYRRVKKNGGAPGIDGFNFEQIEAQGVEGYLEEIKRELETDTYRPSMVKRVYIPKANGKHRPLGIPTIKDRIVQMSCKMVIEPIFEADFEDCSYGFRPKRSSKDAIEAIKSHLKAGRTRVLDADLSSYFDTIPHDKLMIVLKERIADRNILKLIKMWLKSPVQEGNQIKGGKKNKYGTPQGGVISPLLANIYLHLIDRIINKCSSEFRKLGIYIVRYADDFVLLGKQLTGEILEKMDRLFTRMELKLNKEKTRIVEAKEEGFNFLGFTVRYDRCKYKTDDKYWYICPSKKSEKRLRLMVKEYLRPRGHLPIETVVNGLNPKIRGWLNYYSIRNVTYIKRSTFKLRHYLGYRLYKHFQEKSQRGNKHYSYDAYDKLVKHNGLIDVINYAYSS
jgi:group II intron reverse transcriptase/maturase